MSPVTGPCRPWARERRGLGGSRTRSRLVAPLLTVAVLLAGGCGGSSQGIGPTERLLGTWRLVSVEPAGQPPVPVDDPGRFTADFGPDGRLAVRADCNRCQGRYEAGPDRFAVQAPLACTLAACPSAPLDGTYVRLLVSATAWTIEGAALDLRSDQGVLRFER